MTNTKSLDQSGAIEDLTTIVKHFHGGCQESVVRRWSTIECTDYQAPLALIVGALSSFGIEPVELPIRDQPTYRVALDICERSRLSAFLFFDASLNVVKYKVGVSDSTKRALADCCIDNSSAIE